MTCSTIGTGQTVAPGGEGTLLANRYRILRQLGHVWRTLDMALQFITKGESHGQTGRV